MTPSASRNTYINMTSVMIVFLIIVTPYVQGSDSLCTLRMAKKMKWRLHTMYQRLNADISPGDEFYTSKALRSAFWRCPILQ